MTYDQRNINELFELIGNLPGQHIERLEQFHYVQTNSSWPNKIWNLKADAHNIDLVLNNVETMIQEQSIPNILMCNPKEHNPSVIDKIKARRYKHNTWCAMSYTLQENDKVDFTTKQSIKRISTSEELRTWLDVVEIALMGNNPLNFEIFEELLQHDQCFFYLGMENDQPTSTSFLFNGKYGAGIYLVSTLEAHRNKGFGKDVTLKCMQQAKELKVDRVDLQATALGKGVYQSIGFADTGDIHVFRLG